MLSGQAGPEPGAAGGVRCLSAAVCRCRRASWWRSGGRQARAECKRAECKWAECKRAARRRPAASDGLPGACPLGAWNPPARPGMHRPDAAPPFPNHNPPAETGSTSHEAYLSAFQDAARPHARFPRAHEDPRRPRRHQRAARQGPQAPVRLSGTARARGRGRSPRRRVPAWRWSCCVDSSTRSTSKR